MVTKSSFKLPTPTIINLTEKGIICSDGVIRISDLVFILS